MSVHSMIERCLAHADCKEHSMQMQVQVQAWSSVG